MSQKSERKKQVKADKQAEGKVVVAHSANWYAEDAQRTLVEHRESCKDPNCTHAFVLRYKEGLKTVAMLQPGEPKKIFLAFYGEDVATPYKPYAVLNLATGEEIAGSFDENGNVSCSITGKHDGPICLTLFCHNKGVVLSFDEENPDSVSLRCAEPTCGRPLSGDGFKGRLLKLASHPKAEYPNIYCHLHGIQPGYLTCKHVRDGVAPMILDRPTPECRGLALCSDECDRLLDEVVAKKTADNGHFGTVCAPSLNDLLGGKLELYHQQAEGAAA